MSMRRACALAHALAGVLLIAAVPAQGDSGEAQPQVDSRVEQVLDKWKLPGASIAIARQGRLVYARGYGLADVEDREPMQPETLMRLASVSKPFTAVGILRLVEQGRLGLDDKAFRYLDDLKPLQGAGIDPRIDSITIRHLLQHSVGWQIDGNYLAKLMFPRYYRDPFLRESNRTVAEAMGIAGPADCPAIIRFMRGQQLAFEPGTQMKYANLNYCIVGRIIERVTGQSYADYMQENVLKPIGISRARLARNLLRDRAAGEAKYYTPLQLTEPAIAGTTDRVPWPYGGFNVEAMDAFGGWLMSAVDVLRFAVAVEGRRGVPLLRQETLAEIAARPVFAKDAAAYQGLGFMIRPVSNDRANWWHEGYLPGSVSFFASFADGLSVAVLTNGSTAGDVDSVEITLELQNALTAGASKVRWPAKLDQFGLFM